MLTLAIVLLVAIAAALFACALVSDEAVFLNLTRENPMAKIGDAPIYRIDPTNLAGEPAPVFNVVFSIEGSAYIIGTVAPDGMSVTLNAIDPGTAVLRVTATSKAGVTLNDMADLEAVEAPPVDEEAVKLGLKRVA